jgi:hypothetical protein
MKKQLTSISPLRAGIVLAVLYGVIGLIFVPFILLASLFGARTGPTAAVSGVVLAICFPIFYAVLGFIGGIIMAAVYNLVAKWTGGLEFEVTDVAPTL